MSFRKDVTARIDTTQLDDSSQAMLHSESNQPNSRDAFHLRHDTLNQCTFVPWIQGLKGLLAVESFLFLYFRTFFPATIYANILNPEPEWQSVLRKSLSPLIWGGDLQWSFFIILSGRVVALKFLNESIPNVMASSIFRRPFRFLLPVSLSMSIAALINYLGGFDHIVTFQVLAENSVTSIPLSYKSILAWLNSMFNLFWFSDALQAGVLAHPGAQIWIITTTFSESYTNYMTMLLLPYMTRTWRIQLLIGFIVAAWWVDSWAWYSVTGLLLADNSHLIASWHKSFWLIKLNTKVVNVPYWLLPAMLASSGVFLKYFYADIDPGLIENELNVHTSTYLVGGTLKGHVDYSRPNMRVDNYLIALGTLILIQMTPLVQRALSSRILQYLGHLSLSAFLLQGCISYTIGIKLFNHFVGGRGWSKLSAGCIIFVVDGSLTWILSDVFARVIDFQGKWLSWRLYEWYTV